LGTPGPGTPGLRAVVPPALAAARGVPKLFTTSVCRKWDPRGKFYGTPA
jgi:hypothetical protein